MIETHTRTQTHRHHAPLARDTWLVGDGGAYRLGADGLPAGTARRDWVLVEAGNEDEALRKAREYCNSRDR